MAGKDKRKANPIIIRREEIVAGGHHGGAWKVAYADFVTAMMAFFLLMWLLNATTEEQRKGLADYFSPTNLLSHSTSGSGDPFAGHTPFDAGALASDRGAVQVTVGNHPPVELTEDGLETVVKDAHRARVGQAMARGPVPDDMDQDENPDNSPRGEVGRRQTIGPGGPKIQQSDGQPNQRRPGDVDLQTAQRIKEKTSFEQAAQQIQDAVSQDPALADLARQVSVDMTPEGLRVQIMDDIKLPMFASGSSIPNDRTKALIQKIVPVLARLNKGISIAGHTDSAPFPGSGRTNWELSAERANTTRRLLVEGGLPDARIRSVTGLADREPLLPADPLASANRRIAIMVLRDQPPSGAIPTGAIPTGAIPTGTTPTGAITGAAPATTAPAPPPAFGAANRGTNAPSNGGGANGGGSNGGSNGGGNGAADGPAGGATTMQLPPQREGASPPPAAATLRSAP